MTGPEQEVERSISEAFDQQVERFGDKPAVAGLGRGLTYAQLARLAERYAGVLARRGVEGERVALLIDHGGEQLAASLAVLRCAASVIALNPADPPTRLAQIRQAVEPRTLIADPAHLGQAQSAGFARRDVLTRSSIRSRGSAGSGGSLKPTPEAIAFLIATSGSTGVPKVVMRTHRGALHNAMRYTNGLDITAEDRIAWLAPLTGAQGLVTTWSALLAGATVCPFPIAQRGVTGLARWLVAQRITVLDTIPSVLRTFARTLDGQRFDGVRVVRIASEGALRSDFEIFRTHFSPSARLASVLASSEAGIMAQALLAPGDTPADGRLPVGLAADGVELTLLNDAGETAADGQPGELFVTSEYLSPGYWRDERLTSERFEQLPDGRRRWRTGDVATAAEDGRLTVIGRVDNQVKVRGNQVQLEEVEAALTAHAGVAQAAVIQRLDGRGQPTLQAFIVRAGQSAAPASELRRRLGEELPPFAVPARFTFVEEIPLTPHGKADRRRLVTMGQDAGPRPSGDAGLPPDPAEGTRVALRDTLLALWSEAFGRQVDPQDEFLELGGDSLLAAEIAAGVDEALGVALDLRLFASRLTVAKLTGLVEGMTKSNREALPPLKPVARIGPLSSGQRRFWIADARERLAGDVQVAVPFAIRGPLDVEVLCKSVGEIVRRHEILRTTFSDQGSGPIAIVQPPPEQIDIVVEDVADKPDPLAAADAAADSERSRGFDVERGPLIRWRLLRVAAEEYRLVRVSHHLIHDALSWRVFFRELATIYEALKAGLPSPLPGAPPLQYIDYAVWEHACLQPDSPRYRAEVDWWKRRLDPPPLPLKLPFELDQGVPDGTPSEGLLRWGLAPATSEALDRLARSAGATHFMSRLAAFAALLALETSVEDISITTPASTRTRSELQDMIGVFLNPVVVRLQCSVERSFSALLVDVRRAVLDTTAHATIPSEQLMRALRLAGVRPPKSEVRFVDWAALMPIRFGGIDLEPLSRRCGDAWGFRLGVNRPYETDRCWVEFDPRRYDANGVQGFLSRLRTLAGMLAAAPELALAEHQTALALV